MKKRKKGGNKMTTLTLSDIQSRVKRNSNRNQSIINEFREFNNSRGLKQGRIRPKDKDEASLLSKLTRR